MKKLNYIDFKGREKMNIELRANEVIEKEMASDYWESFLFMLSQKRGRYCFTNQRIVFQGGFATEIEIPYAEIESIKKCCVGGLIRIMPTGIKVTMKDGKKHYLSVLKRGQIMELIQSKIN